MKTEKQCESNNDLSLTKKHNKTIQTNIFNSSQKCTQLIVNADDFGISQCRDNGIIQLIKQGRISSISVLVNGVNIQNSSTFIKQTISNRNKPQSNTKSKDLSVGLHLNLTQGKPLFSALQCQLISSQTGQFKGKPFVYDYFKDLKNNKQSLPLRVKQLIKTQLRLQIHQFIQIFTFRPSHIDGHNHVHVIPEIAQLIAPLMIQNGIYKVRLPAEQISNTQTNPMNRTFSHNAKVSKKIFDRHNIIYPTYFIGLEEINELNVQRITQKINNIPQSTCSKNIKSIEIMCHPGYADPYMGDEFNKSKNRQIEMANIKTQEFQNQILNHKSLKISNYNQLSPPCAKEHKKRILLYSKMNSGSGNWTTSLRLQQIFESLGYDENINTQYEVQSMREFLINFKITLIVGVNLTRSARVIYTATRSLTQISYRVPYIFIVAGTDANIYFNSQDAPLSLKQPIEQCSLLLSLSQSMLQLTEAFLIEKLNYKKGEKQLIWLSQSSNILSYQLNEPDEKFNIFRCFKENYHLDVANDKYIVFPASFREVKDIQFLLTQFNLLIQKHHNLKVLILGPILNQIYYEKCLKKLNKVEYLGSLQKQLYVEILKHALLLVNTSVSQGQCCSIQQGLQVGQICVCRNNEGNAQLIKHQETGFLFQTPEQFVQIFQTIIKKENHQFIEKIRQNALEYHKLNFSIQAEAKSYKKILDKILPSKQKLFSFPNVHPVCEVNLNLYDQIPQWTLNEWFDRTQNPKRMIDIGCGCGIFSLVVLQKFKQKHRSSIQLQLYDFDSSVLSNSYYNCLQESQERFSNVKSIKLKVSDMFQNIQDPECGNLFVANLPQTPFQNEKVKPDKNGGKDSIKFNEHILRKFSQFNQKSMLILLYSYMSFPRKFFSLIEELDLEIKWSSQKLNHRVSSKAYELMEAKLPQFLKMHIKQGRSDVQIQKTQNGEEIFMVPAQIIIIQKKKILQQKKQGQK